MKRILSLVIAATLLAASCSKDTGDQPALAIQNAGQYVSAPIQSTTYARMVTLVLDLDCQAVGHIEVRVPAGSTVASGYYNGNCKVGAVRLGSIRTL